MKHTVDVPPHGSRTIEFKANEPGEWIAALSQSLSYENRYGGVVKYSSYIPKPEIAKIKVMIPISMIIYFNGMITAASNHAQSMSAYPKLGIR